MDKSSILKGFNNQFEEFLEDIETLFPQFALMFEDAGTTEGLTWATVIGINSPSTLQLKGHLSPENGGPAITFTKIELLAKGKVNTKLKVSETVFGSISEKIGSDLTNGWKTVFEKGLKAYLERNT